MAAVGRFLPLVPGRPIVYGTSPNWIYFHPGESLSAERVPEMSNGQFTSSRGRDGFGAWIAKHDGSEILPLGQLTNTYRDIHAPPISANVDDHNFVRGALEFGLPDS